jgi:hypothetical protein
MAVVRWPMADFSLKNFYKKETSGNRRFLFYSDYAALNSAIEQRPSSLRAKQSGMIFANL